ncbi:diguanylate cyclase [Leclercia adecarboxylata]|uniref:diguanylate cyclase n=1 Tax=Leclercia adecarboxylata TaxID=83655 RepID=UPI0007449BB9|nr:diguanylate cyclase [Leclercia adecarboxylata]ALZ96962.1 diguanylate cyclase [Leclercia adecarboxylata]MDU1092257.1 diguanylate cyclase [Leclercia adecarboxylata]NEG93401.1 diguanylate cyclase [Leclercia adecarboxylata]UFM71311.1 diguanylate cyclase [Leclercia adecarboxylata]
MNRKFKEIDDTVRSLNQSTDAHFRWLVKILRFIDSRNVDLPEISSDEAHLHCEFGHWLNTRLLEEREDTNFLLDINKKHIHVHQACRNLISAIEQHRQTNDVFNLFEESLLAFTEALTHYKVHLLQLRTSYDALTGLPLRRILDESFASMNKELGADGLYLLLLDIDHFKKVNDNYGHLNGDIVLRSLALNISNNIRRSESMYRYGGEEFIVVLHASNDQDAVAIAERLRRDIARLETIAGEHLIRVTFTGGLTRIHEGEALREVLERADIALYTGKKSGRNCSQLINRELQTQKFCD